MPGCVEFWQIAAYTELEIKGNMFSGRSMMLQGLRQINGNSTQNSSDVELSAKFDLAYLKFEKVTFEKMMKRRDMLREGINGDPDQAIDFVNEEMSDDQEKNNKDEVKEGDEANLLKIVYEQIAKKYVDEALVLREAKRVLQACTYL